MSRTASYVIGGIALFLCIVIIAFGLPKLSQLLASGDEFIDSFFDIKSLRNGVITLCTVSVGLFAVFFELGSKDKYGHNIKQGNHFELICLKKETNKSEHQLGKRVLSGIVLSVYPTSIGFMLLSTLFYIFHDSKFAVYSMFLLFCVSALLACWYVLYILHIVYSRDWIVKKVKKILEAVNKKCPNKIDIATKAMRILATSDYPTPNDVISIHQSALFFQIKQFKGEKAEPSSSLIDYYANLIVSYFLAAKGVTESVDPNSIINAIFRNDKEHTDYSNNIGDYPFFVLPVIVAIKELNHIFREGIDSPIGMDTLLLRHKHSERFKYKLIERLNAEYGSGTIRYLSDRYIYPYKAKISEAILPNEFIRVNDLASYYFGNN